ncbi:MAG: (2Fe-2S) ferredoxin domain-containing protein [Acidaminococcales bacterium]|jgi:NADP-reducing hydrogenase subunit HndB|nr:(2Fe-2S) ferredoxin domain-containing protein [Acidaminococcales bacterium]
MKSLEELKKLREKLQSDTKLRAADGIKVIVGMGTCGIAAGAREVMAALMEEVKKRGLAGVVFQQTGCIGMCEKEVLVDIILPGAPRITYGNVRPSDAGRLVAEHVINGQIVKDLVVAKSV